MDTRPSQGIPPPVVVGIDPDPSVNHRSVRWAAREASLRGAALHLVYAWESAPAHRAYYAPMRTFVDPTVQRGRVRELLDAAEQAAHHVRPGLTAVRRPIEGPAVPVLLDAASGGEHHRYRRVRPAVRARAVWTHLPGGFRRRHRRSSRLGGHVRSVGAAGSR